MPSYPYPRPALTVDVVLFRYHGGSLQLLLIERDNPPFEGRWALPGGFVDPGESPEAAAQRELMEEAAAEAQHLSSLGVFGAPGRDPRGWVVSAAFLGLGAPGVQAQAGDDARSLAWFSIKELPELAFDHGEIISKALERLREQTQESPAPLSLLPAPFRSAQARHLYNQIWDHKLSPSAFKAWLRRRDAVRRVGPARFQAQKSLRFDWCR